MHQLIGICKTCFSGKIYRAGCTIIPHPSKLSAVMTVESCSSKLVLCQKHCKSLGETAMLTLSMSWNAFVAGRSLLRQYSRSIRQVSSEVSTSGGRLTDLSGLGPARFYKQVDTEKREDGQYCVTLDGRCARTPRKALLKANCEALALALAAEWDAQTDRIRPSSMPLTTLAATAQDVVPEFRPRILASILKYLDTDTLCIRPSNPQNLVKMQEKLFSPIERHLAEKRNLKLNVAIGELKAPQSAEVRAAVSEFVHSLDDLCLAALDSATATAKSLAIAITLHDCGIDAETALRAARSEEAWQESVWGTVEGGHDLDAADVLVRLSAASFIFRTQASIRG